MKKRIINTLRSMIKDPKERLPLATAFSIVERLFEGKESDEVWNQVRRGFMSV